MVLHMLLSGQSPFAHRLTVLSLGILGLLGVGQVVERFARVRHLNLLLAPMAFMGLLYALVLPVRFDGAQGVLFRYPWLGVHVAMVVLGQIGFCHRFLYPPTSTLSRARNLKRGRLNNYLPALDTAADTTFYAVGTGFLLFLLWAGNGHYLALWCPGRIPGPERQQDLVMALPAWGVFAHLSVFARYWRALRQSAQMAGGCRVFTGIGQSAGRAPRLSRYLAKRRQLSYHHCQRINKKFMAQTPMLTPEEAQAIVLENIPRLGVERVSLLAGLERVLAQDLVARRDNPSDDNSAMDGYAVRWEDIKAASGQKPAHLKIVEEIPAGYIPQKPWDRPGQPHHDRRVVPEGADTVLMQEDTRTVEGGVEVLEGDELHANIRRRGEDVFAGANLVRAGVVLARGNWRCWLRSSTVLCRCFAGRCWRFFLPATNCRNRPTRWPGSGNQRQHLRSGRFGQSPWGDPADAANRPRRQRGYPSGGCTGAQRRFYPVFGGGFGGRIRLRQAGARRDGGRT